jgi:putative membrane protein
MKLRCLYSILLGPMFLSSSLLFAQFDPVQVVASQTQPNRPQQQLPSTTSMQDSAPNSGDVGQLMQDKMFLRRSAEGGIAEVKLGQLAADKASSDDVKAFGKKMVDDHTRINNDIAQVADSMGVMLPKSMNKDDQAEYDKIAKLTGNDFDIEYLTYMVKDHHQDLRAFRIEAASPTDPALHEAVVKAESVIHDHKVMVDKLAHTKGVPVPAHGGNHPSPAAL